LHVNSIAAVTDDRDKVGKIISDRTEGSVARAAVAGDGVTAALAVTAAAGDESERTAAGEVEVAVDYNLAGIPEVAPNVTA